MPDGDTPGAAFMPLGGRAEKREGGLDSMSGVMKRGIERIEGLQRSGQSAGRDNQLLTWLRTIGRTLTPRMDEIIGRESLTYFQGVLYDSGPHGLAVVLGGSGRSVVFFLNRQPPDDCQNADLRIEAGELEALSALRLSNGVGTEYVPLAKEQKPVIGRREFLYAPVKLTEGGIGCYLAGIIDSPDWKELTVQLWLGYVAPRQ